MLNARQIDGLEELLSGVCDFTHLKPEESDEAIKLMKLYARAVGNVKNVDLTTFAYIAFTRAGMPGELFISYIAGYKNKKQLEKEAELVKKAVPKYFKNN